MTKFAWGVDVGNDGLFDAKSVLYPSIRDANEYPVRGCFLASTEDGGKMWARVKPAAVCGGTGNHDGQDVNCCDECCAEAEKAAEAGAPCAIHEREVYEK